MNNHVKIIRLTPEQKREAAETAQLQRDKLSLSASDYLGVIAYHFYCVINHAANNLGNYLGKHL